MAMQPEAPCPCGRLDARKRPLSLAACCGAYLHDFGGTPAPDAESLMRSRYTAFVLEDAAYLLATWHPTRRPADLTFDAGVKWLGLDVRSHRQVGPDRAEVEFVARSRSGGRAPSAGPGQACRLHERSRFVCEHGRWYYVDGELK
jgi:SEC-C motif-containing protein